MKWANHQLFVLPGKNSLRLFINNHKYKRRLAEKKFEINLNVQSYRLFLENKKVILSVLQRFSSDQTLAGSYEKNVVKNMERTMILAVKFHMKHDVKIIDKIIKVLIELQLAERKILKSFLYQSKHENKMGGN